MATETSVVTAADNRRGMIALTFGMAAYTINDTIVKTIARELPFGEVIFLRGVLSVMILIAALMAFTGLRSLGSFAAPVLWRALFDGLSTAFFVAALVHMKLARLLHRGADIAADPHCTCRSMVSQSGRMATLERHCGGPARHNPDQSNPGPAPSTSGRWWDLWPRSAPLSAICRPARSARTFQPCRQRLRRDRGDAVWHRVWGG